LFCTAGPMTLDEKIVSRIDGLIQTGLRVLQTRSNTNDAGHSFLGELAVNSELSSQWVTSCLNILDRIFGKESDHYARFKEQAEDFEIHSCVMKALGVLKAAKDDYENGYLFDTRQLIQAEVFDTFLDQAEYLCTNGYHAPAAVVGGSVLENGLRELCIRLGLPLAPTPKLDTMNADLAKAGAYNLLTQKQITALADLRNKAAHGKWTNSQRLMLT
jgi:hypothetical protein